MDLATVAIIIAGLGFGLNAIVALRNWRWDLPGRLNDLKKEIMAAVSEHRDHTDNVLTKTRDDLDAAMDRAQRSFGETVHAMQAKIQQLELWARDTFVRRDSFMVVIKETKDAIEKQGAALERSIDKIDKKLDGVIDRQINKDRT